MKTKRIGIILARGGSKRLPRKNILDLGGKPMIAWSIMAAIKSNQFDRVLVSTDDLEIAEISRGYGAEVPFLRYKHADDLTSASQATHTATLQAEEFWGERYDVVVQLMANCPLRTQNEISHGISVFEKSGAPSQISCFRFGWMNPWWSFRLLNDGRGEPLFSDTFKKRSQDMSELYCPSGALWIAKRDALIESKDFYMTNHRFEPLHWISAMDIDNEDDFLMAEICQKINFQKGPDGNLF